MLTNSNHPVSIFSEIHSSKEKDFTSINDITFSAMERASALFKKATFVMDRDYDDNKMFLKLDSMEQDYVIRLTSRRKLFYHNKWVFATELRNRRKGKVKLPVKAKIVFCYYRLAKGISGILSYAKEGIRLWFRTKRPAYRQLCLKLAV